ncbi:SPFH domain-containing protein [Streptococcus oralis]|uniref:SPFH domain-containing protein n=1 Tax=Streptococcus oralis TaxID=1303 RepID=A0A139QR27_STROR|nr:SPFH domain-containing protein [Streptococcus oralis]KXU04986.1 hypothetical protein SORDD24_00987 [Streptococcus oralis]
MGFIRAALSAGLNSFHDSKFKEAVVLPDNVSSNALAVKGQLLTKDPDGRSRHSNQNTGLLTDGSVVIVPQGYTAILVNNGTFLGDVLEAGSHEWQAGDNAWLLDKGGFKGTWENFKNRFSFGGQVITQQEIIFIRMQPIAGNKFGTQNAVEYFSERYQQLLNIRFYGLFDIKISDPVLFYISSVSRQITDGQAFTLQDVAQGTLRQNIAPKIAIAIANYTNENKVDIYSLNANQETFNELAKQEVNKVWTGLYGIEATHILLEDLSYDPESLAIVRKLDSELVAMKYNTIEIEERRARNEALVAAANNEGGGNGMNLFMGMNLGQTLGGELSKQAQPQATSKNFYIEVDGKYVLVTKDEDGNIVPVN